MTRAQKIILGVLSISVCAVWLAVVYFTGQWDRAWSQQPLGPTLAYPTQLQLPATWTASPVVEAATQPTIILAPTPKVQTQTPISPVLYCRNNLPTMTILGLGA